MLSLDCVDVTAATLSLDFNMEQVNLLVLSSYIGKMRFLNPCCHGNRVYNIYLYMFYIDLYVYVIMYTLIVRRLINYIIIIDQPFCYLSLLHLLI